MMHLNIAFLNIIFSEHFSGTVLYYLLSYNVYVFTFTFSLIALIQMLLCSYNRRPKCLKKQ